MTIEKSSQDPDLYALKTWIQQQAVQLGFTDCGVVHPDNPIFAKQLTALQMWLAEGNHGEMAFFAQNHDKRANPALLVAGTQSIISVRLDYLVAKPPKRAVPDNDCPDKAIIARYARGRDYHKTMRGRLKTLANRIEEKLKKDYPHLAEGFVFRPFSDSAPIFERALAEQAGLGWTGKHTLLINRQTGSFFVLGELFTSLPLPATIPTFKTHCGTCTACIDICPTQAIVEPYMLDARKCIAYLTIEYKGIIPEELRQGIGNRVFGCDDCQLICPWNSFAKKATISDFNPRHNLDDIRLLDIWHWNEETFLANTEGSPLRRTGYQSFKRNIAIGLGNAPYSPKIVAQLQQAKALHDEVVNVHIDWAIQQQLQHATIIE